MEPAGSLPRTKDLIAGSYPELHESSLYLPILKITFYLRQIFFSDSSKNFVCTSFFSDTCHMYRVPQ